MKRSLLLVAVATLAACATYGPARFEQAAPAYVPVAPPPAYTPGFAPGTPTAPTYTPAGAGLYQPDGSHEAPVERSPNKRILPASGEAGLWAADGDPALMAGAAGRPRILDVELPFPSAPGHPREGWLAKTCASQMGDVLMKSGEMPKAWALTPAERQCLAASMYALCTQMMQRALTEAQGQPPPAGLLQHVRQSQRLAADFEDKKCPDGILSPEGARIQRNTAAYWSRVHGGLR